MQNKHKACWYFDVTSISEYRVTRLSFHIFEPDDTYMRQWPGSPWVTSGNALSLAQRQIISWANAELLSAGLKISLTFAQNSSIIHLIIPSHPTPTPPPCHIYASVNRASITSDNGFSPVWHHAIIYTNAGYRQLDP